VKNNYDIPHGLTVQLSLLFKKKKEEEEEEEEEEARQNVIY